MIIDSKDSPLVEAWKAAREAESAATKALHAAMKSGDRSLLPMLTQQMEEAHNKAMDIYEQLQARSLDRS